MRITKIKILLLTCFCLICACQNSNDTRTQNNEITRKYNTASIAADLIAKAKHFDSYAQDYVFQGHTVKRMSFLFKKNGKDFYSYRSDFFEYGKNTVGFLVLTANTITNILQQIKWRFAAQLK